MEREIRVIKPVYLFQKIIKNQKNEIVEKYNLSREQIWMEYDAEGYLNWYLSPGELREVGGLEIRKNNEEYVIVYDKKIDMEIKLSKKTVRDKDKYICCADHQELAKIKNNNATHQF